MKSGVIVCIVQTKDDPIGGDFLAYTPVAAFGKFQTTEKARRAVAKDGEPGLRYVTLIVTGEFNVERREIKRAVAVSKATRKERKPKAGTPKAMSEVGDQELN